MKKCKTGSYEISLNHDYDSVYYDVLEYLTKRCIKQLLVEANGLKDSLREIQKQKWKFKSAKSIWKWEKK